MIDKEKRDLLDCYHSLVTAMQDAHGSVSLLSWKSLEQMSVADLLITLAPNNVRFIHGRSTDSNEELRRAARLIARRHTMVSGSLEMGECDEYCRKLGLKPWDLAWVMGAKV